MTNKDLHIEKKEFSYKMEQSEKQNIIDIIKSYNVQTYFGDKLESETITEISNILQSSYSFERYPFNKNSNEDSFKCFIKQINDEFADGHSMTREMMDKIKFAQNAVKGATYSGAICAINTALVIIIDGGSVIKAVEHAVGYGLLGAFAGGVYNGYNEASLEFNNKFDGAIKCFGPELINPECLIGKVHTISEDA